MLTLEKCMELIEKEGSKKKPGGSSKKTPGPKSPNDHEKEKLNHFLIKRMCVRK